jgi:hypothetical protein
MSGIVDANPPTPEQKAEWAKPWTDAELADLGIRPVTEGGKLFCGVTLQEYAIGGVTHQWPRAIVTLNWSMNFSRLGSLSDMDFKDCATAWLKEISDNCNRVYKYVANPRLANILYTVQRLDARMGVLADMQIPVGNMTPDSQLVGRFDDSEDWVISDDPKEGQIDLYRVGGHETQHAEGCGHKPSNITAPARIAPTYSRTIRYMQPADVSELVRRNGPARNLPPVVPVPPAPPAVPAPPGSASVDMLRITVNGVTYECSGVAKRVK